MFGAGDSGFSDWGNKTGSNGCYTVTGSNGHTTGSTTRTVVLTSTVGTSVETITTTQTGTLVAAAVATGSSATPAATSTSGAMGRGCEVNGVGGFVVVAAGMALAL